MTLRVFKNFSSVQTDKSEFEREGFTHENKMYMGTQWQ